MTKLEIINETVEFYSKNPRAIKQDEAFTVCRYITESGSKCAVGRCLDPDNINVQEIFKQELEIREGAGTSLTLECRYGLNSLLQDKYKGHSPEFWRDLQMLHDVNDNWTECGLSKIGLRHVEYMKKPSLTIF